MTKRARLDLDKRSASRGSIVVPQLETMRGVVPAKKSVPFTNENPAADDPKPTPSASHP